MLASALTIAHRIHNADDRDEDATHHATTRKYFIEFEDILATFPPPVLIGPPGFESLPIVPTAEESAQLLHELWHHDPNTDKMNTFDGPRGIEEVTRPIVAFAGQRIYGYNLFSGIASYPSSPPPSPSPQDLIPSPESSPHNPSSLSALKLASMQRYTSNSFPITDATFSLSPAVFPDPRDSESRAAKKSTCNHGSSARPGNVSQGGIRVAFGHPRRLSVPPTISAPSRFSYASSTGITHISTSGLLDQVATAASERRAYAERMAHIHESDDTPLSEDESVASSTFCSICESLYGSEEESEVDDEPPYAHTRSRTLPPPSARVSAVLDYRQYDYNNRHPVSNRPEISPAPAKPTWRYTAPVSSVRDSVPQALNEDSDEDEEDQDEEEQRDIVEPSRSLSNNRGRPFHRTDPDDSGDLASRSATNTSQSLKRLGSIASVASTPADATSTAATSPGATAATPTSSIVSFDDDVERPIQNLTEAELRTLSLDEIVARVIPLKKPTRDGRRYPCPFKVPSKLGTRRVQCTQICKSLGDMKRHLRKKGHIVVKYPCLYCSRCFTREDALKRHQSKTCSGLKDEDDDDGYEYLRRKNNKRKTPY